MFKTSFFLESVELPFVLGSGFQKQAGSLSDCKIYTHFTIYDPVNKKKYDLRGFANSSITRMTISEFGKKGSKIGHIKIGPEGVAFGEINGKQLTFTRNNMMRQYKKIRDEKGTVWHQYPDGRTLGIWIGEEIIAEIVTGGDLVNCLGLPGWFGEIHKIIYPDGRDLPSVADSICFFIMDKALWITKRDLIDCEEGQ